MVRGVRLSVEVTSRIIFALSARWIFLNWGGRGRGRRWTSARRTSGWQRDCNIFRLAAGAAGCGHGFCAGAGPTCGKRSTTCSCRSTADRPSSFAHCASYIVFCLASAFSPASLRLRSDPALGEACPELSRGVERMTRLSSIVCHPSFRPLSSASTKLNARIQCLEGNWQLVAAQIFTTVPMVLNIAVAIELWLDLVLYRLGFRLLEFL